MRGVLKLTLLFVAVLTGCNNKTEFILLPYHSDTTRMTYNYLVSNPPKDLDSLDRLLVAFFVQKQIKYNLKDTTLSTRISYIAFTEKNSTTSYFIDNADDPGGWSSEELSDYFIGIKKPMSGLGRISCWPCESDSSKFVYTYINILREYDKRITILRDECTPNWYEENKNNELVRLFNENMPF